MSNNRHFIHFALYLLMFLMTSITMAQNKINGVRVWPSPDSTRIVFDLKKSPEYTYFSLENPYRLVVDFKSTSEKIDLSDLGANSKLIKRIRQSKPKNESSLRVVLELTKNIKPIVFPLKPTAPYGNRLVIDLIDHNARQKQTTTQTAKLNGKRDVLIAIDAGHGGEDPGSIGGKGTYEKKITLLLAKSLKKKIDAEPGFKAVLVRTSDYYIKPNRRSEIARRKKADFLISIHADAFTTPKPSGASVWVLSLGRANTEIGRWMEKREKHSELLGGAAQVLKDTDNEKYLAQALLDMSMEHSMSTGYDVALEMIRQLGKITKMHKKRPQSASLAVLNSPDIPSILVEVGFISNHKEEKNLNSSAHRKKLTNAMYQAVLNYYMSNPPKGTLIAERKVRRHTVQSGDSLSKLAKRYRVSVARIKSFNNLSSNTVRIGQVLEIPST